MITWQTYLNHPRFLIKVILIETLILAIALGYIVKQSQLYRNLSQVKAESQVSIDQDVLTCKSLPVNQRPSCAEKVGAKIAFIFGDKNEQIKECMKFRPNLVRWCQKGLLPIVTPTPTTAPQDLTPTVDLSPTSRVMEITATTAPTEVPLSPTP